MDLRAVVIANDVSLVLPLLERLSRRGVAGIIESEPQAVLDACKVNPPALVIVEDRVWRMSGIRFLSELVKVSWTTSAILISNDEEEVVHQKTEGLGILGRMRSLDDLDSLERLLDKFLDRVCPQA
jgi:DNA-binding NarL/FixJ family response regulator